MAPATATAAIANRDARSWLAMTPPNRTAVSPGSTKPTNRADSAKASPPTSAYAAGPFSARSSSAIEGTTAIRPTASRPHRLPLRGHVGLADLDQRENHHERRCDQPGADPERHAIAVDSGERV